jgi:hypothetical protein
MPPQKNLVPQATIPDIRREAEMLNISLSHYLIRLALLHDKSPSTHPHLAVARLIIALGMSGHDHDDLIHELHEIEKPDSEPLEPLSQIATKILQDRLNTLHLK